MIKLIDRLYQSGFPDFKEIIKENINIVIHLAEIKSNFPNISPEENLLYIWWPIKDGPLPDTKILNRLADLSVEFLKEGKKLLISCAAGINRSSLLASLVMMKFLKINGKEAIDRIRKKNPSALSNENFYHWLIGKKV